MANIFASVSASLNHSEGKKRRLGRYLAAVNYSCALSKNEDTAQLGDFPRETRCTHC